VREVNDCLRRLGETILPGAWLVDTYPVLRFVPGYLGRLRRWHLIELGLFRREMEGVRREVVRVSVLLPHSHSHSHTTQIFLTIETPPACMDAQATGLAPDSFASYLLAHQEEYSLSDDEAAYLAGSMFGAGADTVRLPLPSAI
jgi:hypothetical protein